MSSESPNYEHIELFSSRIEERYNLSRLKDWPLDELQGQEFLLRNEFERFKNTFPNKDSIWQGKLRQYAADDLTENKHPLTTAERLRLENDRKTAESELNRAIGYRKEKRRDQRSDLVNDLLDLSANLKYASFGLFASIRQLTPW